MSSIRSTVLKALRRVLVPALAATPILSAASAGAETFDLHIYRYCEPNTWCGHGSDEAYKQYILEAVQEMNLIWEPTGFSFRPDIMAVDSTSPTNNTDLPENMNKYWQTPGCSKGSSQLRQHWRANVAKPDSKAISIMVTKGGRCCSGIPRTFKNLQKEFGIFCNAHPDNGAAAVGGVWAHEMGHHWCLSHTHGRCADTADGQNPTIDVDAIVLRACSQFDSNGDAVLCGNNQNCIDLGLGNMCIPDLLPVVGDTPADRCKFEKCKLRCQSDPEKSCVTGSDCGFLGVCTCPGADENGDGILINGHTWFGSPFAERDPPHNHPDSSYISEGSPHSTWCPAEIKVRTAGVTNVLPTNPSIGITVRNVMSYHGMVCRGPHVILGTRQEAFTQHQLDRIAACRLQISPRDAGHLPDVCLLRGGDTDHDGICDLDDNCPLVPNTSQRDRDGDGDADACDLCPDDPNPTGDIDGDGIGDACDEDRDGDGCLNDCDDHPNQGRLLFWTTTYFSECDISTETTSVSDAFDTDWDGIPNCEDADDDNDGICDAQPLPNVCNAPPQDCTGFDLCPEIHGQVCDHIAEGPPCPPFWFLFLCELPCLDYYLKVTELINPDPTRDLVFERIWMVNRTIFAAPLVGKTAAESAVQIADLARGGALTSPSGLDADGTGEGRVRLEIWQRQPDSDDRFVATVGEYDEAHVLLGELVRGRLLRLAPTVDGAGTEMLEVETTHAIGIRAEDARDRDDDGAPDLFDNCVLTANAAQIDTDHDGFGNACDADLDQDGTVDDGDVERIAACEGVDLSVVVPILEPETLDGEPLGEPLPEPDPEAVTLAALCAGADLDGDGDVDAVDTGLAAGMFGDAPGPSTVAFGPPPSTFTIAGAIYTNLADVINSGLAGVTVTVDGDGGTFKPVTAAGFGTWQVVVPEGTYTVTPVLPGWSFQHVDAGTPDGLSSIVITVDAIPPHPEENLSIEFLASAATVLGACCNETGTCDDGIVDTDCEDTGGRFLGDGSTCEDGPDGVNVLACGEAVATPPVLPGVVGGIDHDIRKNRFVSINPNNEAPVTLRVELLDLACSVTGQKCNNAADCKTCVAGANVGGACTINSDCSGGNCVVSGETCDQQSLPVMLGWVGDPVDAGNSAPIGTLVSLVVNTQPPARMWTESVVHIMGCHMAPKETYGISATTNGLLFSDRLVVGTIVKPQGKDWADLVGNFNGVIWSAPNGLVGVDDVTAMIKFLTLKPAPHITVVDLAGSAPKYVNFLINATDLGLVIKGFKGETFPPLADILDGYPADGDVTQCP